MIGNSIQIAANIAVVVGLVYAGYQIRLLRQTHRDNHDWNRRKCAQEIVMEVGMNISNFRDLSRDLNLFNRHEPIPLSELDEAFKENPDLELKVLEILNIFEGLARGIKHNVYDRDIVTNARRFSMIRMHEALMNYLTNRKKERSVEIYPNFDALVNEWRMEKSAVDNRQSTGEVG